LTAGTRDAEGDSWTKSKLTGSLWFAPEDDAGIGVAGVVAAGTLCGVLVVQPAIHTPPKRMARRRTRVKQSLIFNDWGEVLINVVDRI